MATLVAGIALTEAAVLRGEPQAAVERTRATVEALTDETGHRPDLSVRLAALALSAVADAAVDLRSGGGACDHWKDTADELVELARETAVRGEDGTPQGPEGLAWLARAEAEWLRAVSGPDAAAWEKAVTAFGYGDVYERVRCRVRFVEALLAAERRAEAAAQAREAHAVAERLGAAPLLERLDGLVRRGRLADAPSSDGERPSPLTPREQEVLRLLARGRSNRQIGEALFITGKTASVHVSNILAKLGASSRTEAVAIAYREGLIAPEPTASG